VLEPPGSRSLTVINSGLAVVTSSPPGISCSGSGGSCNADFPTGTVVTLTYPGPATTFVSWSGACSGGNLTCPLTLSADSTVAVNWKANGDGSRFTVSTASTMALSNAGVRTDSVMLPQTRIVARYLTMTVYDQIVNATYAAPASQAAVAAAAEALHAAAGDQSLRIPAPVLADSADVLLSSAISYSDAVTESTSDTAIPYIAPATFPQGQLGLCTNPPTQCPAPIPTLTIAGGTDIDVLHVTAFQVARTTVTTNTYGQRETYVVGDLTPSDDANLIHLTLSGGILTPAFASATADYEQVEPESVSSVVVTPTASDSFATITVDGALVASGAPSAPIALSTNYQLVTVVVTAVDGITTRTYTVLVVHDGTIFKDGFETANPP
jgi:hypothetical protein